MLTSSLDLTGRVAVITGATSGIGRAITRYFVSHGACVVANGRHPTRLAELERLLDGHAGRVKCIAGDASQQSVVETLLDTAPIAFGTPADIVVVNAGRGLLGSVISSDVEQWDALVAINLLGCARLMRAAGARLLQSGGETSGLDHRRDLIVLGSVVARHVSPFSGVYGATKASITSLTESLRRELAPKGVRVTLIEPGFVESEFQSVAGYEPEWFDQVVARIGPILQPDDVARVVGFVVSQPPHVHINDVMIRPTRQDYP